MKQKLSNYIANFLIAKEVKDIFTVTGGGAMHLNNLFGHHKKLKHFDYMIETIKEVVSNEK